MCFPKKFLWYLSGILLLASLCLPSYGQILLGPKAGIQYGWVNLDNDGNGKDDKGDKEFLKTTPAFGVHAGVTAIFKVKERFYLDAELLYALRQQVLKGRLDSQLKNTMFSHMIELPLTFRMNFDGRMWNLKYQYFVGAGPNVSYWLFSTGKLKSSELDEVDMPPLNYSVRFEAFEDGANADRLYVEKPNRVQLGINAVAGLMFTPSEGNAIKFDIRFDYGHSYFAQVDYGIYPELLDYAEPLKARYSSLKICVAYIFDTKVSERKKGKSTFKKKSP